MRAMICFSLLLLALAPACGDDGETGAADTRDTVGPGDGTDDSDAPDTMEPDGVDGADGIDGTEEATIPDADDVADEIDVPVAGPGLGIDYGTTAAGATPRYDLEADDWMSVGWPSDRYRSEDGHVELTNMPRGVATLLLTFMAFGEDVLNGWGLNGSVYFELDGDLDPATLPSPEGSRAADSVIQLVNVSRSSPAYGERLPLVFSFYQDGNDPVYSPHTLAMRAVFGFPLLEGDTYCAVVTRAVQDTAGNYLQQAPGFIDALVSEPWLAPLRGWLPDSQLALDDIAVASCFTAQDATGEMIQVAEWIDDMVPPEVELIFEPGVYGEFRGTYIAPNFQAGEKPYNVDGDIRFDEAGDPIVQADEEIRFLLLTPIDHELPEEGWPVTLYSHGTGGDYETCRWNTRELVADGIAVLCIDQPLHGSRGPGGVQLSDVEVVLFSFNFVNPYAGRSNFRQSAIDTLILSRMIEANRFVLEPAETKAGTGLLLDPERIFFFGHSHGGLSGSLALAVDPRLKAGVISGMAGVIIETVLRRKDPADLAAATAGLLRIDVDDLDSFHPALTLLQTLVDATDPINYARYWTHPRRDIPPKHVFVTQGTVDAASPSVGNDAATAAGDLPQIRPLAKTSLPHVLRGIEPLDLPVRDNVVLPNGEARTVAMRAWQGGPHGVAFQRSDARAMWRHFFYTAAFGDGAELGTGDATLTQEIPVSSADTCPEARPIPTTGGFPIVVRGNTGLAGADFVAESCGDGGDPLGAIGRDVFYRFTAPAEGTYRFRIALQPKIDRDTPRYGPDLVAVLDGSCGSCLGRKADGSLDLSLAADETVVVAVDGTSWLDTGAFALVVEERCLVLACGERECGDYGCSNCGSCGDGTTCVDGRCVERATGDTCASAIPVETVPFIWNGDTRPYLNDGGYGEGQCPNTPFGFGNGSDDLVFAFTPPSSGRYGIALDGDYDTNVWVADACEAGGDACLAADRTNRRDARVVIDGVAGQTEYVFVDGGSNGGNSAGHATLEITTCTPDCTGKACGDDGCGGSCGSCPDNGTCIVSPGDCAIAEDCPPTSACEIITGDRCEDPFVIDSLPYVQAQNTATFHTDYGLVGASCGTAADGTRTNSIAGFNARDVAYRFVAPNDGLYLFRLDTGDPVFAASLYVVSDCSDLEGTCLAADDREKNDRVWLNLVAEQEVFAIVDGVYNFSDQTGRYTFDVRQCVPSCEDRECGSDGCLGSCGGCDDGLQCQNRACRPPPGEVCTNPRNVGRLPWQESRDTSGWGADQSSGCEGAPASSASPDYTYRFVAPSTARFRFIVQADYGAQVYFDAGCGDEGRCLAEGAIPVGGDGFVVIDREMNKNDGVLITIDGIDAEGEDAASSGSYTFSVQVACDPDCEGKECGDNGCGGSCGSCAFPEDVCGPEQLCIDPVLLSGNSCTTPFVVGPLPFTVEGDTSEARDESLLDEGQCSGLTAKGMGSADQVWRFTAEEAGDYHVEVTPDGWDAILYVLEDCADPVATCLGADDGQLSEAVTLTLGAGQTVFIVIDGEDNILNDAGPYRLDIRSMP